ncbi:MAG: flippase-like domain-containing protein [Syntrophaceae bacterium]|nr:flippase-like domain-containing protein [Syntrophaceae bacterium]
MANADHNACAQAAADARSGKAPRGRGTIRSAASLAALLAAVAGICAYLWYHPALVGHLLLLSPWDALLLSVLGLLAMATNGIYQRVVSKQFGIDLAPREWFGLAAVTAMGNYLTPFSGGLFARAIYLKRRHDFPYTDFAAVLASNYMIVIAVVSVTGTAVLLPLAAEDRSLWPLLLFFAAALSILSLSLFVPLKGLAGRHRLPLRARQVLEGFARMRRDRALLARLLGITLFNVALGALLYVAAFHAIGSPVPWRTALLIYLLTSFAFLINITPGNLGVQEIAAGLAAALLGAGGEMGFLASLVIRAVTILLAFTLGPIFSCILTRELAAVRDGEP